MTELIDVLTAAFKADRWVQPGKAAKLALDTIKAEGYRIVKIGA